MSHADDLHAGAGLVARPLVEDEASSKAPPSAGLPARGIIFAREREVGKRTREKERV